MQSCLKNLFITVGLLIVIAVYSNSLYAHAGKIIFVSGDVTVIDKDNKEINAKRGLNIWPGDTIITGPKGRVQLRTGDHSEISLQENSRFIIRIHNHNGPAEKQNSAIELFSGSMRAVTGAIGKVHPENYKIKAGTTTIGVRGTEIVVKICNNNCLSAHQGKKKAKPIKNGVYIGVLTGAISVAKEGQKETVELDASLKVVMGEIMGIDKNKRQYVFVDDAEQAKPEALREPPAVIIQALSPPPPEKIMLNRKPVSTLDRYEGISAQQMHDYLALLSPKKNRRLLMAKFDDHGLQSDIDPLIKHREINTPYYGHDISGLYDLTSGNINYVWP